MALLQPPAASQAPPLDTDELRVELKAWEHEFVASHGRKPGKSDIKANKTMATKYKLYDKLTRGLSTKTFKSTSKSAPAPTTSASRPSSSHSSSPLKRKRDSGISLPPSHDQENIAPPTPQKTSPSLTANGTVHPSALDPYDPPLNTFFSPLSDRTYIAPTPQKNGRVLGIFDLLSPESAHKATPSKSRTNNILGTPSRSRVSALDLLAGTPSRSALTPSKNRVNGAFATPSNARTRKLDLTLDETPECLKRYPKKRAPTPEPAEGADGMGGLMAISLSPVAVRQPRRRFGRSYSELAKDIKRREEDVKKREEKRLDEEMDLLREMEEEGWMEAPPAKKAKGESPGAATAPEEPLGKDPPRSSVVTDEAGKDLPLGPDGDHEVDRSDGEDNGEGKTGQRRWKKRGPKRQTRKFNIRPNHVKWKPEPEWKAGMDIAGEGANEAALEPDEMVPETQVVPRGAAQSSDDGSEFGSEDELASEAEAPKAKPAGKKPPKKTAEKSHKIEKPKPARKVSATAHANYRTLKIKNKNSKGKKGGRFGRRR